MCCAAQDGAHAATAELQYEGDDDEGGCFAGGLALVAVVAAAAVATLLAFALACHAAGAGRIPPSGGGGGGGVEDELCSAIVCIPSRVVLTAEQQSQWCCTDTATLPYNVNTAVLQLGLADRIRSENLLAAVPRVGTAGSIVAGWPVFRWASDLLLPAMGTSGGGGGAARSGVVSVPMADHQRDRPPLLGPPPPPSAGVAMGAAAHPLHPPHTLTCVST